MSTLTIDKPTIKTHIRHSRTRLRLLLTDQTFLTLHGCGCIVKGNDKPDGKRAFGHAVILGRSGLVSQTLTLDEFMRDAATLEMRFKNGNARVVLYEVVPKGRGFTRKRVDTLAHALVANTK